MIQPNKSMDDDDQAIQKVFSANGNISRIFTVILISPILIRIAFQLMIHLRLKTRSSTQAATHLRGPPRPLSWSPGTFYGLAVGEASDSDNDDEEALTSRELRHLQQSPSFQAYCHRRGITLSTLEAISSKLRLYKRLKTLDPSSFWLLCKKESLIGYETLDPGISLSIAEYLLTTMMTIAALLGMAYMALTHPSQGQQSTPHNTLLFLWPACISYIALLYLFSWSLARPASGPFFNAWYVDLQWNHTASTKSVVLSNLMEALYVGCTCGVGALVSLGMRLKTGQSVSERIMRVKMVVEKKVRLDR